MSKRSSVPRLALCFACLIFMAPARAETAREAIAMFLYGQPDPENVRGRGVSGMEDKLIKIVIEELGSCKYKFSEGAKFEIIDFSLVAEIRHSVTEDFGSKIRSTFDASVGRNTYIRKVAMAQVMGTIQAVCGRTECVAKRAFMFDDLDQLDRSKRAAAFFRARFCPGRKF